jgi:ABC-type cobalamin transport system ATPase subunit
MGKTIDPKEEKKVEQLAGNSLQQNEVITLAMAEIWVKQGNMAKAREVFSKLSLLEPSKSTYFANRINELNASL